MKYSYNCDNDYLYVLKNNNLKYICYESVVLLFFDYMAWFVDNVSIR